MLIKVIIDPTMMTTYMTSISFTSPYLSPPSSENTFNSIQRYFSGTFQTHHKLFDPNKPINTVLVDEIQKPSLNYHPSSTQ